MRFPSMCIKRDKEKESKDSFFDGRGCAENSSASHWMGSYEPKICLGNIRYSPVWNFLGETEAFFLTFYAKK